MDRMSPYSVDIFQPLLHLYIFLTYVCLLYLIYCSLQSMPVQLCAAAILPLCLCVCVCVWATIKGKTVTMCISFRFRLSSIDKFGLSSSSLSSLRFDSIRGNVYVVVAHLEVRVLTSLILYPSLSQSVSLNHNLSSIPKAVHIRVDSLPSLISLLQVWLCSLSLLFFHLMLLLLLFISLA